MWVTQSSSWVTESPQTSIHVQVLAFVNYVRITVSNNNLGGLSWYLRRSSWDHCPRHSMINPSELEWPVSKEIKGPRCRPYLGSFDGLQEIPPWHSSLANTRSGDDLNRASRWCTRQPRETFLWFLSKQILSSPQRFLPILIDVEYISRWRTNSNQYGLIPGGILIRRLFVYKRSGQH